MSEIVNKIKDQFTKVLNTNDWKHLLEVANYHFEIAAKLKKKDIKYTERKLLMRNSMKRLHLGIGVELALKAAYLKKGICINCFKRSVTQYEKSPIHLLSNINKSNLKSGDTYTLGILIDKYPEVFKVTIDKQFLDGLKIAMVFRNKEGHTSFPTHEFKKENYKAISKSIINLYNQEFNQKLKFNIAMKARDKAIFKII